MKKKLTYFVMSLSLMFTFSAPILVHAEGIGRVGVAQAEAEVEVEAPDDTPTGRATRVDAYKKNLKETLTETVKTRIIGRCVAAQAILKTKAANNSAITKTRDEAYNEIIADLEAVVTAAKAKSADTTDLEANITTLKAKIAAFKTVNATYQQVLADLAALDCKVDPTAFKATLESTRTAQKAVFTSAKDIRTYIHETVKVTLKALKTKLKS